jgi:multiple sugar transport system permease protein
MRETRFRESQSRDTDNRPKDPQRKKSRLLEDPRTLPYLLIAPAIVFEMIVHIIPMFFGVGVSFFGLTQFYVRNWAEAPFVGIANYASSLDLSGAIGSALLQSFLLTLLFTGIVVGGSWVLGMIAALLVNGELRGRGMFRTLFLIPYALPVYVTVMGWSFMLQKDNGAVNTLLVDNLHILDQNPFWLVGDNAFWSMVMIALWRSWPFAFLMLLAALQTIPGDVYEAASVDGASHLRQFRAITLPLVAPVSLVVVLVLFLWTFNEFNVPYVLFGQAPPEAANLLSLHIYVSSFVDWNFGLGAAMSALLLLFLLAVSALYVRALRIGGSENA